jgi:hypothetical protein
MEAKQCVDFYFFRCPEDDAIQYFPEIQVKAEIELTGKNPANQYLTVLHRTGQLCPN